MSAAPGLSPAHARLLEALSHLQTHAPLVTAHVPVSVTSAANVHGHWRAERTAGTMQRRAAYLALNRRTPGDGTGVMVVRLTRHIQPRGRPFDTDNLARALKNVRDGVADAVGVDDGSDRYVWLPDQVRDGGVGVTVELWVMP